MQSCSENMYDAFAFVVLINDDRFCVRFPYWLYWHFQALDFLCRIFQSCIFTSCILCHNFFPVQHFPALHFSFVPHFPVSHFQSPYPAPEAAKSRSKWKRLIHVNDPETWNRPKKQSKWKTRKKRKRMEKEVKERVEMHIVEWKWSRRRWEILRWSIIRGRWCVYWAEAMASLLKKPHSVKLTSSHASSSSSARHRASQWTFFRTCMEHGYIDLSAWQNGDIGYSRFWCGEWGARCCKQPANNNKAQYTPPTPTRRNCWVESRRVGGVYAVRSTIWKLTKQTS